MKNMIKLGLLSTLLPAALLAEGFELNTFTEVVSPMQTDMYVVILDQDTGMPSTEPASFLNMNVDPNSKIDGVTALDLGTYVFNIKRTKGCDKSGNGVKGVFSTLLNGNKVDLPYTMCTEAQADKGEDHFETAHPYKDNTDQEKVLFAKLEDNAVGEFEGYAITIEGETETKWDTITFKDPTGKVLKAKVFNNVTEEWEDSKELEFSGKLNHTIHLEGPEEGLAVKVHFTSDGSITKEGVKVDMEAILLNP